VKPTPTLDAICALLDQFPEGLTFDEIGEELGMMTGAVQTSIRHHIRKGGKRVRIMRYDPPHTTGNWSAVIGTSPGPNVRRPKAKTRKELGEKHRAKHRMRIRAYLRVWRAKKKQTGTNTMNIFAGLMR
jgi:hypothetical protein